MRSPPRSPRPSARQSAPRCQPTQPGLAREAATREDCCGRERGPGDVEGGREGGRTSVTVRTAGTADLQAWSRVLPQCRHLCEPKARVRERCLGRTYCRRRMAAVSVECVARRVVVPECLVPVCVFDLVPHTYRIHHTRGANARQLITAHITRFYLNLSTPRGVLYSGVRTCAASSCCKRSLSVRSTPPSSFGSSCVAACTATGGSGAVSK